MGKSGSNPWSINIVTHRGIEANPEQIRAIHSIPSPKNVKAVQKLIGRMAD